MTRTFKSYTIQQFEQYIENVSVNRKITHIQIHHTWRPRKTDYKGESTILGMWNHHVNTNKWVDIGQHFSVAPDGLLWDGRNLEADPAGIKGHNEGGLMFEMIGDFDQGQETLEGKQLYAITKAVAVLLKKFNLTYADIVFHREFAPKTCPGTGIKKEWFIEMVKRVENRDDVKGHWAEESILKAKNKGIMKGYPDGTFKPDQPLTRGEMAAILDKLGVLEP